MAKLDIDEMSRDLVDRITFEIDKEIMANIIDKKSKPGIIQKLHIEAGIICKNCRNWVYGGCWDGEYYCKAISRPGSCFSKKPEDYCSLFDYREYPENDC